MSDEYSPRVFWEEREQDLVTAVDYCQNQLGEIALKEMGQIALPITIKEKT